MKIKRILSGFIAAAIIFGLFSVIPVTATVQVYPTPEGYSDHDYQKLIAFFTQNENNMKIIDKLGWDLAKPETWGKESFNIITWNNDLIKQIISIELPNLILSGTLDISDCVSLEYLLCYDNILTNINASGCKSLKTIDCANNKLISINVFSCDSLSWFGCSNNNLTILDVSNNQMLRTLNCPNNNLISLIGFGCYRLLRLSCSNNKLTSISSFEDLGSLIIADVSNNNLDLNSEAVKTSINKIQATIDKNNGKFYYELQKSGEPPAPPPLLKGDVNGDGKVDTADALDVLRHVVGIEHIGDYYFHAADLDGDGNITTADALAILKIIVGL
ncbi:MAG: dockerin type I domain-containing protein [Oscillospiraceae bacterium]|nr:dockerin type I domain-containing protein [Oscillospiraceae bacterium]